MLISSCYCNVIEVINGIQSKRIFLKVFAPVPQVVVNALESIRNYSATSNNTKLVHWPLMGRLFYLVQRGGAWAGCGPAQSPPRCTKCNSPPVSGQCTNHCTAIRSVALRF